MHINLYFISTILTLVFARNVSLASSNLAKESKNNISLASAKKNLKKANAKVPKKSKALASKKSKASSSLTASKEPEREQMLLKSESSVSNLKKDKKAKSDLASSSKKSKQSEETTSKDDDEEEEIVGGESDGNEEDDGNLVSELIENSMNENDNLEEVSLKGSGLITDEIGKVSKTGNIEMLVEHPDAPQETTEAEKI